MRRSAPHSVLVDASRTLVLVRKYTVLYTQSNAEKKIDAEWFETVGDFVDFKKSVGDEEVTVFRVASSRVFSVELLEQS